MLLEINHLEKVFRTRFSKEVTRALQDVDFKVDENEFIAIMGESGSGKTTLLNILATLEKPTNGSVILNGEEITKIKESKLAEFRLKNLGFVFQDFNLLDTLSVKDEPTAALDYRNSEDILNLFEDINSYGQTLLMVTHSANAASHAKRVLFIKDGRIFHQIYRGNKTNQEFSKDISLAMTALLGGE